MYKKTACCNVCKSAGKPWTTHFPKDSTGRIVCPTLLGEKRGFHCKVCKDSGKSEAAFTSHNVKDKTGKVCCPTLLNQSCKKCGQMGHTFNYCTVPKERMRSQTGAVKRETPAPILSLPILSPDILSLPILSPAILSPISIPPPPILSPNVTLRKHQTSWASENECNLPSPSVKRAVIMQGLRNGTICWADIESDDEL